MEKLEVPVFGQVEIQYIVNENGVLRMPISIEIMDDSSLEVGFTSVKTSDPVAKGTVARFLKLASKTLNANPHKR